MEKIRIVETPYKPATRTNVCSHLVPVVQLLEVDGADIDWTTGVIPDKNEGNILLVRGEINFDLIDSAFEIPKFIHLHRNKNQIFCEKCWCIIESYVEGKIYSSSVQPAP